MKKTNSVRQGSNRNIRNMVDVNKSSHTHATRKTSQTEVCQRDVNRQIAEMFADTVLYSDSVRLFYAKSFDLTDERTEIITSDKFVYSQLKMAAHRLIIENALADMNEMARSIPVKTYLGFTDKATKTGYELTLSFDESVPSPTNNDELFRLLGVPEAPKLIEFSNDEVGQLYRKFEQQIGFTNEGVTNDEFDAIFVRSDYPEFFSKICEAMVFDDADLVIPTLTNNEFGNVLNSFHEYNAEVALATLCKIKNNHSLA